MPALGDEFRAAREARHLSLSDVSEQIHIRSTYLESIEHEDWAAIAAPVYVKGFIRTYARFLGLDPEEAVRRYVALVADGATGSGPAPRPISGVAIPVRGPSPLLAIGGIVALAVVAFVAWSLYQSRTSNGFPAPIAIATTPASADASPAPAASGSAVRAAARASAGDAKRTLVVRATSDCWLSVRVDGGEAAEMTLKAGTEKAFHGSSIDLTAGNAGGLDIVANGKDRGTLGASGEVVERTFDLTKE
jgi:cytoskeletal protein RodZ